VSYNSGACASISCTKTTNQMIACTKY
jgi:hypothetical protein